MNKAEELTEEDFILKWGFIRGMPFPEEFKRDLEYQFESRVNSISDEEIWKENILLNPVKNGMEGTYEEGKQLGFEDGAEWFKNKLLNK